MRPHVIGALAALTFFTPPAGAQPAFYVQATGYANAFTGVQNKYDLVAGNLSGTGILQQGSYHVALQAQAADTYCIPLALGGGQAGCLTGAEQADAYANGSVAPGVMHMAVNGLGGMSPVTYSDALGLHNNVYGGGKATESVTLGWGDQITFNAPGMALGTPISVLFALSLDGSISILGDTYPTNAQDPNMAVFSGFLNTPFGTLQGAGGVSPGRQPYGRGLGFPNGIQSLTATVLSGQTYRLSGGLSMAAVAASAYYAAGVTSGVDASNTALVGITVLTPGATFTSASGYGYLLPQTTTPEPAPLALLALGGALLLAARRRERA